MIHVQIAHKRFSQGSHLHIKCELQLSFGVRVVHLKQAVNEFFEVDVATRVEIQHCEKALSNDSGQLTVLFERKKERRIKNKLRISIAFETLLFTHLLLSEMRLRRGSLAIFQTSGVLCQEARESLLAERVAKATYIEDGNFIDSFALGI